MEKAGVEMDLTPLADLVEDLKSQEREYYKDLLAGAGVEPSEKNVDLMAETMDVFAELKQQPAWVERLYLSSRSHLLLLRCYINLFWYQHILSI